MNQIDQEVRESILALIGEIRRWHDVGGNHGRPCQPCNKAATAMLLLEREQREYGPPIDVTDPSWLRDHPAEAL